MSETAIRPATTADADAIAAIYAPYVRDTAITFEEEPPDAGEMARRIAASPAHPWLVAESADIAVGYAYAAPFHRRPAYRWSVETSVYVGRGRHRQGIGSALYRRLLDELKQAGFTTAVAGIALPGEASVLLHERFGFVKVAHYAAVGYKLGAWHDVGWWQRPLATQSTPPHEPHQP